MSETIDEIEDVLLEKKARLREKLDVLAPVRERPLQAVGVLFGVGLVLGLLTGGGDDDEEEERPTVLVLPRAEVDELEEDDEEDEDDDEAEEAWARAELWEDRAQRLLRIARAQEEELEVHRAREVRDRRRLREWEEDEEEGSENFFDRIRDVAAERLSGIIGEITERMSRG
jgi:hypothetical protein